MNAMIAGRPTAYLARVLIALAFLALAGAWITQLTDRTLMGMNQQHCFDDAGTLALLGIALFLDAFWHARRV